MEIAINQNNSGLLEMRNNISTEGKPTHYSSRSMLSQSIKIFDPSQSRLKVKIVRNFPWFLPDFTVTREDNSSLRFKAKSLLKMHFVCQSGQDTYEIFGHKGWKYSVFKNNVQVAWFEKGGSTSWSPNNNFRIISDSDADTDLIITFCLIIEWQFNINRQDDMGRWENLNGFGDGKEFKVKDTGNIGPVARQFDQNWQPK